MRGRPGAIELPADASLVIVEGVGAGRREIAHLLDATVWVQSDLNAIERRNAARVAAGETSPSVVARWMHEEFPFVADQRPWERALLVVAGTPELNYSPTPVLVVPAAVTEEQRKAVASGPVLVAYDGSTGADVACAAAEALFPARRLLVASVDSTVAKELAAGGSTYEPVVLKSEGLRETARAVAEALARHASDIGAAAIVVGSRGRSAHREILLGSVAMATLHHAHRPVLAVPPPNRLAR
jgi:nucleotide-binding universal stress UspA family protein